MGIRTDTINLLRSSDVALTDFTLFGYRVTGRDYAQIANCIANDQIQIVQIASAPATRAAYERTYNSFTVGAAITPSLIVHEATHAVNDWYGRTLDPVVDECLAYTAQMIFVCRQDPRVQSAALSPEFAARGSAFAGVCSTSLRGAAPNLDSCTAGTIAFATMVAATLRSGATPDDQLLQEFRQAVRQDPNTDDPERTRAYDRISRVTIPPAELARIGGVLATD